MCACVQNFKFCAISPQWFHHTRQYLAVDLLWIYLPWFSFCVCVFKIFFFMWTTFKVFNEFVIILFYDLFFFGREACGILGPWPGIKRAPPPLEGVLTIGQPGKSLTVFYNFKNWHMLSTLKKDQSYYYFRYCLFHFWFPLL